MDISTWLQAHAPRLFAAIPTICLVLGAWAAIATVLIKQLKRPSGPAWAVFLYHFILDWPAALPGMGLKGFLGLPINIPFFTLSTQVAPQQPETRPYDAPPQNRQSGHARLSVLLALAGMGLAAAIAMAGCNLPDPCAVPSSIACKALSVVVACAVPAGGQGLAVLIAGVTPAITGASIDWWAIAALEQKYGTDAVMCALQQALVIAGGSGAPRDLPIGVLQANADRVKTHVGVIFAKKHIAFAAAVSQ